jgi:MFS family permease
MEFGGFVNAFGTGVVYPFLFIYLRNVRGFDLETAGLIVGTNAAVALVSGPVAGAVIDRVGARRTLMPTLVLLAGAFVGFAFIHRPWQAFLAATGVGIGNGFFWPSQNSLLAGITPEARRHAGFSLRRVSENLGFGLGGATAGLVAATSRPGTFTALFAIDAATYLLFLLLLLSVPEASVEREAAATGNGYRDTLRDRVFVSLLAINVVFVTAGYAQLETLPVFAKNHMHVAESGIGLVFLANSLVIVVVQLPVTKLVEGRRRMAMLAVMTLFWATAWLVVFATGLWLVAAAATAAIVAAVVVFGVGECLQGATQQALIADLAPPRLRGRYMALSSNSWSIGWIAGPVLGALMLEHTPNALWPTAAAACLVAGAAGLLLERRLPTDARRTPEEAIPAAAPAERGLEASV